MFAVELAARLEEGFEDALDLIARLRELKFRAALFLPEPDDDSSLVILPDIYRHVAGGTVEPFADPNEAADIFFRRRMRAAAVNELESEIGSALRSRSKRLRRLCANLERDLILANIGSISRGAREAEVEDIFKGDGSRITISLDPALDPPANAERYYKRARKARRALESVKGRLEEVSSELDDRRALESVKGRLEVVSAELDELAAFEDRQKSARAGGGDLKTLRRLQSELVERGWLTQIQKKKRKVALPPGRRFISSDGLEIVVGRVTPPGRRFISSDGLEIVVGRNNKDNEVVTFTVGRDNDFWFHAAGYAGSHVLVRNTSRLQQPPPATLAQAASLAAYYSKARQSRNVQVHWTERRFLKKVKGGAPGKVLLTSYRSTTANPEIPAAVRTR